MKTVLITGANRGLGKGFVKYLLDQNMQVFAGIRNPENFDKTKIKNNSNLNIIQIDVSQDKSIKKAAQTISRETGQINFLINNAGINKDSATNNHKELVCNLSKLDRNLLLKMYNVNAVSPIIVLQQFYNLLKNSDPSFVINISSDRASFHDEFSNPTANYGYRASKVALNMMTFCSLYDIPKHTKTFAVHPGQVKSNMNPDGTDLPYDQAKKIIDITKNWKDEFNGKFLRYDGTYYPL